MTLSVLSPRIDIRSRCLFELGASVEAAQELLRYNATPFRVDSDVRRKRFPLASELHIERWARYVQDAQQQGVAAALRSRLAQLCFPIQAGISQSPLYRAVTLQGLPPENISGPDGLAWEQGDAARCFIHPGLAGEIPVLVLHSRRDFVASVQAFTRRNEPEPVPDSQGACIVTGYNNWDRIRLLRQTWAAGRSDDTSEASWLAEFRAHILPYPALYRDTFILMWAGPYSHVPAAEMEMSASEWERLSALIRLEHECTHYFTQRVFGAMRNNPLDELLADYRGIVAAAGRYRADWFLRFMGLEDYPGYRDGGRLQNYRGNPPLSDDAFRILQGLVVGAAQTLEALHQTHAAALTTLEAQARWLMALAQCTLEELAAPEAAEIVTHYWQAELAG